MVDIKFLEHLSRYKSIREQNIVFIRELEQLFKKMGLSSDPVKGKISIFRAPAQIRFSYLLSHPNIQMLSKHTPVFERWSGGNSTMGGIYSWTPSQNIGNIDLSLIPSNWEEQKIKDISELLNAAQTPHEWWSTILENADVWTQILHHWQRPDDKALAYMSINKKQALNDLNLFVHRSIASVAHNTPALLVSATTFNSNDNCFTENTLDWSVGCPFLTFDTARQGVVRLKEIDAQHTQTLKNRRDSFVKVYRGLNGCAPPVFKIHEHWEHLSMLPSSKILPMPIDFQ